MPEQQELEELYIIRYAAEKGQPQFTFQYQESTGFELIYEVTVQGVGHVSTAFPLDNASVEEIIGWLAKRLST
jgi:hypothetical protein